MSFLKIICGIMVGVLLAIKLKGNPVAAYLSIAISLFVMFYILNRMSFVVDFLDNIMNGIGLEAGYLEILLKLIGISYLCEFTSGICKETGFVSVAGQIEVAGKLTMMVISLPVLFAIVDTVTEFL